MLNGTNKKCAKCTQECKQWEQVKVIVCPKFKPVGQQARRNAQEDPG